MSKEIVKVENLTPVAYALLEDIREVYRTKVEKKVLVYAKDEKGNPIPDTEKGGFLFVEETQLVNHPIVDQINGQLSPSELYKFVSMVKPEEQEHIKGLIDAQKFEFSKAIQAFENSLKVVNNRSIQPRGWVEAEAVDSPTLATLRKYKGEKATVAMLHLMLMRLVKRFGKRSDFVDRTPDEQVEKSGEKRVNELAKDILANYYLLTIADLKLIFGRLLRQGKKIFSLDYQTIFDAIDNGYLEKNEFFEKRNDTDHKVYTMIEKHRPRPNIENPPDSETQLKQLMKRANAIDEREKVYNGERFKAPEHIANQLKELQGN